MQMSRTVLYLYISKKYFIVRFGLILSFSENRKMPVLKAVILIAGKFDFCMAHAGFRTRIYHIFVEPDSDLAY